MRSAGPPSTPGQAPCRHAARYVAPVMLLALLSASSAFGQAAPAAPADNNAPVTRQEYEALKKELAEMRTELTAAKKERADQQSDNDAYFKDLEKIVKDVQDNAKAHTPGSTKLIITGDAAVGFTAQRGAPSSFNAGVAPRFLWELNDRILFDAAMDIGLNGNADGSGSTSFNLQISNVSYLVNDYITVGAGLFVVPFGQYHNHFDPPWINPLPDDPLIFSDGGLAPGSAIGAFVSGVIPVASTKVNYAVYGSNGPSLEVTDPNTLGSLHFDNYGDLNNNKAYGGRIGFLPTPELEVGYSIQYGQAGPQGFDQNVNALLQAVDVSYRKQYDLIGGTIHARAEWVWSNVGNATYTTYDSSGNTTYGPNTFNNDSNGGYFLISYRPTLASYKILRNFEIIGRYDRMDIPVDAPNGKHDQRYTVGLDYWFDPRVVLKTAYECDDIANAPGAPAFMVQIGVGF